MKESKVCKRFRDFCATKFNDKQPFPITVSRLTSYIKYRGRSLSTFQDHLLGLEKHEKHGPEWIRQVRNDPEVLKLVDLFDNRIKANSRGHQTLRSRWGSEGQSDKPEVIRSNGLVYGQNGAVCTEVKGPKNKGFRVIIMPSVPQERPSPFVSRQSSAAQTPPLTSSSSSSSSSLSPPQRHQQHSQMLNNNNNINIDMPAPIDIDDYSDVMYDDTFDQEYLLEQQQVPNQSQQQPDHISDISFGDDEEFERSIMNQISTPADNRRIYSILDSYDFDEVENIAVEQADPSYPEFDFDLEMDGQVVQNDNTAENVVSNNNSDDDDFDAYVHSINHSDQDSDTYSDYSPSIYITQRYLRPKPTVQIVQQVLDSSQPQPTFYSQSQINALSFDEHYEPVILIKASEKRKACFLFDDEAHSTQANNIESSDQDDFIDDSLEGGTAMDDDDDVEQESSKARQKKKSVYVPKNKSKIRIRDEVITLVDSDTDEEQEDDDNGDNDDNDDDDDEEEEDDGDGTTADMLDRLKKSNLFDLYKKRMSGFKK